MIGIVRLWLAVCHLYREEEEEEEEEEKEDSTEINRERAAFHAALRHQRRSSGEVACRSPVPAVHGVVLDKRTRCAVSLVSKSRHMV